jgi:hypothetical protein
MPIKETINITKHILRYNNIREDTITKYINFLHIVLTQNNFSYDNKYYTCNKWVALGFPASSTVAEIFLQHYENVSIKHWIKSTSVTYYSRYVDDIFIIFNTRNTTEVTILSSMNNINKYIEFKITAEENNTINYLNLTIIKYADRLELGIFHKPTATSTTIYAQSNHQKEHNTEAYRCCVQGLHKLPLSEDTGNKEIDIVKQRALDNGYTHGKIKPFEKPVLKHRQKEKKYCTRNTA